MITYIILCLNLASLSAIVEGGKVGGSLGAYCLEDAQCFDGRTTCVNETCICDTANGYVEVGVRSAAGGGALLKRSMRDELKLLSRKERGMMAICLKDLIQEILYEKGQHKIRHHQRHNQRQPDCGTPTASLGYKIDGFETTTEGSRANFICDSDYVGEGGTVTCQSDGTWKTFLGCLIDCGSPANTTGYTLGAVSTTTDGSTVDVSCDSGYGGLGGTITCQSSGSWSAATGCSADCGIPTDGTGYTLTYVTSTLTGDKVPFVCDSRASYCGHAGTIECLSSGSWSSFHGCKHDVTLCSAGISYKQPETFVAITYITVILVFYLTQ